MDSRQTLIGGTGSLTRTVDSRRPDAKRQRELDEVMELEQHGLIAKSAFLLDDLIAANPGDYHLLKLRATLEIAHDAAHEAQRAAIEFASRFPDDEESLLLLAAADLKANHPISAMEHLDLFERREGGTHESSKLRIDALNALGRTQEANLLLESLGPDPLVTACEIPPPREGRIKDWWRKFTSR